MMLRGPIACLSSHDYKLLMLNYKENKQNAYFDYV